MKGGDKNARTGGSSQPIPAGIVARVAAGVRFAVTGKAPDAWFGPLEPLEPLAPPEVAGRQFDYPAGYNVVTEPRAFEGISFRELRSLADSYDVLRLVIETRKDQLVALDWEIKPRDKGKTGTTDPRIKEVTDFLAYPDREHSWEQWLRMLVEDMLVLDAATLYPRRTNGGQLYALEPIDGATIKRVLDDYGRTPLPPEPAYQQILKGLPAVDYTAEEIIYLPRNVRTNRIYGYGPVEQVLMSVNIAIRRQVHQLNYFTEGNVPEALIGVPDTWTVGQIREFQEYWDALLEGNLAQRRHARFVPGGIAKNYVPTKEPALKDDYDEWLTRIVCYAFSVSAQWAIKQMNRATADNAQEQALQEGLGPLKIWIKGLVDRLLAQVWGYPDLELGWHEEEATDPLVQAQVSDFYLRNATLCINDVLAALGLPPTPGGEVHRIYTAMGAVTLEQADKPPTPAAAMGHNGGPPLDDDGAGAADDPAAAAADLGKAAPRIDRDRSVIRLLRGKLDDQWRAHLAEQGRKVADVLAQRFGGGAIAKAAGGEPASDAPSEHEPSITPEAAGATAGGNGKSEAAAIEAAVEAALASSPSDAILATTADILQDAALDGVEQGLAALPAATGGGFAAVGNAAGSRMTALANPRAVAWAAEHAAELVSGIDQTTRTALYNAIVRAEDSGASVAQLAQEIEQLGVFSPKRAALIAETELANADIQGNLTGWRTSRDQLGLTILKRWLLGMDENHCPACLANAADGAIPLDDDFSSCTDAPTAHPHCTCDLVPVVVDGDAAEKLAKGGADQPRDSRGRWAAGGAIDKAHEIVRGQTAIAQAIRHQSDVHDAFVVPKIGPVTLVWGKPGTGPQHRGGYGISKIVAKHGADMAHRIPEIAIHGQIAEGGITRTVIHHGGDRLVLARGGSGPSGPWVLTAYRNEAEK